MECIFLLWVLFSAAADVVYRKCFNWLIVSGFGLAILSAALNLEMFSLDFSLNSRIIGFSSAGSIFLIFYICKIMGAGDVKFAAVLGAWLGWKLLLPIWALSCIFSIIYGMLAQSNLRYYFFNLRDFRIGRVGGEKRFIPYVAFMSIAAVVVLMLSK